MSEIFVGAKATILFASGLLSIISFPYLNMSRPQKIFAFISGIGMAYIMSEAFASLVDVDKHPGALGVVAFFVGMFGVSICKLMLDSLHNSDLSIKVSDLIEAIKSLRG